MEIEELEWLTGTWQGEGLGGICEEIWSSPAAGEMLGMFRLIRDEQVSFYELMTIEQASETLHMRIKHFDPGLIGWEQKDACEQRSLTASARHRIDFDGISYELTSQDEMIVEMLVRDEGKESRIKFVYRRLRPG